MVFVTGAEAKITSQIPCYAVAYLSLHRANNSSKNTPQLSSFLILVLSWLLQYSNRNFYSGLIEATELKDTSTIYIQMTLICLFLADIKLHLNTKHLISEYFWRFYSLAEGFRISEVTQLLVSHFHTFPRCVWIWINLSSHLVELVLFILPEEIPVK